jgi:hypothetical protein
MSSPIRNRMRDMVVACNDLHNKIARSGVRFSVKSSSFKLGLYGTSSDHQRSTSIIS